MTKLFSNTYVLDFREYGPIQDEDYKRNFYMYGHLNPMGYVLTAKMVISYIDYIIRHKMEAFKKAAFIGTEFEQLEEERTINDDNEALIFASYHEIIK